MSTPCTGALRVPEPRSPTSKCHRSETAASRRLIPRGKSGYSRSASQTPPRKPTRKKKKPRWLAACRRGFAMEGVAPSEMPRLLLSCMRTSLIPRSSELHRSLPLKGDATPVRPAQSGLEEPTSGTWGYAARGKGHGEEDIWKAWVGDHRLDDCRGDRGEPFDCGCSEDAPAVGQRARCGSGSGSSGSGVGARSCQLGRS